MTVVASPAAPRTTWRRSSSRLIAQHPEWWAYVAAALAWIVLARMSFAWVDPRSPGHGMEGMDGMVRSWGSLSLAAAFSAAWSHWALMVAATMLPVVAPQVRTVALRSLWRRRQRSALLFVVGYAAVWLAFGAALVAPLVALDAYPLGTGWLVGILVVAAVWHVSVPRRRVLRRCGSLRLRAPSGLCADRNCLWVGIRSGGRCVLTCGPAMAAMVASHNLLLMAGLFVVILSERRRGPDPLRRVARPLEAWAIAGIAGVALAAAVVG